MQKRGRKSAASVETNVIQGAFGQRALPPADLTEAEVAIWREIVASEAIEFFNTAALQKTEAFYEKHGGKTLVISRFLPLFRTFAPFVAGVGKMDYLRFCFFNLIGAGLWVISLLLAGYFFGNLPWVKQNLSFVIVGIVVVSLLPAFVGWLRHRKE